MNGPVRVVIADDHPMFRDGLVAALAAVSEVEVVGVGADGAQLLGLVEETRPGVVLTDLTMPGVNGTEATRQIVARHPEVKVIVLTMHDDDMALVGALEAGANGYLLKGADREQIVHTILAVAAGGAVFGDGVGGRIVNYLVGGRNEAAAPFPELTPRERDILELVALGLSNHQIAHKLALSEKTIRNNVANVLAKLQLHDRAAAVAMARDAGLGGPVGLA